MKIYLYKNIKNITNFLVKLNIYTKNPFNQNKTSKFKFCVRKLFIRIKKAYPGII